MQQFITLNSQQFEQFMANPPQTPINPNTGIALGFNPTPTVIGQPGQPTYTMQGSLNDLLFSAGASSFALPRIDQMQAAVIPPIFYSPLPNGTVGSPQFMGQQGFTSRPLMQGVPQGYPQGQIMPFNPDQQWFG